MIDARAFPQLYDEATRSLDGRAVLRDFLIECGCADGLIAHIVPAWHIGSMPNVVVHIVERYDESDYDYSETGYRSLCKRLVLPSCDWLGDPPYETRDSTRFHIERATCETCIALHEVIGMEWKTIHLSVGHDRAACGVTPSRTTTQKQSVNCRRCVRTILYREVD